MRTRKRIGASLGILLLFVFHPGMAQKAGPHALVAGTIFRDPGFAFPRVEVTLSAEKPPPGVKSFKPLKTTTDARGEFVFRVPAGSALYRVRAAAPGFGPAERQAAVNADERVDVYLELKPISP